MSTPNDPQPPAGLSPSQAYRWITGCRHFRAADQIDINALDPAERARHFARLRATVHDLLRLCSDLSPEEPPDVF